MPNLRGHAAVDRRPVRGAPGPVLILLLCLALVLALAVGSAVAEERSRSADPEPADALPPPLAPPAGAVPPAGGEAGLQVRSAPDVTFAERVVELVNQARWDDGRLPPLKQVAELDASSETHSFNMADRDFFAHCDLDTNKGPSQRAADAGYTAPVAENIAAGYATPEDVMAAWMASTGHKANILSSVREIGVGYFEQAGDQGNVRRDLDRDCTADSSGHEGPFFRYWTQNFGTRSGVYPLVIEREAHATACAELDLHVYGPAGAVEMRFSDDGASWSAWEAYSPSATWILPGASSSPATVFVQVSDGVSTYHAEDSIVLGSAFPEVSTLDVPLQTVSTTESFMACHTVSAIDGFQVDATGDVTFRAGQRIVLGDGFSVAGGGTFRAVVDPAL